MNLFVILDTLQAASVRLEVQDLLLKTGLKDRIRLLLGPFSCSTSLEARWCRHSGRPGPEPGAPKLLLDLKGGLLQVWIPMTCIQYVHSQDLVRRTARVWKGTRSDHHLCTWLCSRMYEPRTWAWIFHTVFYENSIALWASVPPPTLSLGLHLYISMLTHRASSSHT